MISGGARWIYVILLSLVLAGAAGNLIDCMFYGLIFNQSTPYTVSYFVPFGQGYADFLTGKVVDMFYFPLIVTTYPDWVPVYGGKEFIFFSPVFNFADASISCSVVALLLFCRKELAELSFSGKKADEETTDEIAADEVIADETIADEAIADEAVVDEAVADESAVDELNDTEKVGDTNETK